MNTTQTPSSFEQFRGTASYITSPELRDVVNVAVALQKPLLIRGEPGTGKTLLAHTVAEALGAELFHWHIKSTTKAQEGLYVYDTVQRLNDSRFGGADVGDIAQYIKLGAVGKSFTSPERSVLLIDEIDKADMEFPNDLLHELDRMSFEVAETQQLVEAKNRPVVIITSNAEKELPDAFLRRCIFHYIDFPSPEMMAQIVDVHHPYIDKKLAQMCLRRFYALRNNPAVRKKPSTSELVDWIGALIAAGISADTLAREIPFLGVLLKREEDLGQY
ncbi:AAA family ATPase [Bradymonas sediminis]|uniref:MoxR family ATPase n=1 Tax=Bradymonas sediminis TaxID=1548548 RepID=A0A2Z4FGP3_9DELT|nr:MoxR family ATPase [Bradymonas sediminis]AWV87875.1 MoxR family ATPase [Bradymonas sediminis]TDP62890.1 MoxR-like ATPase [Bradymonas sediminis]